MVSTVPATASAGSQCRRVPPPLELRLRVYLRYRSSQIELAGIAGDSYTRIATRDTTEASSPSPEPTNGSVAGPAGGRADWWRYFAIPSFERASSSNRLW